MKLVASGVMLVEWLCMLLMARGDAVKQEPSRSMMLSDKEDMHAAHQAFSRASRVGRDEQVGDEAGSRLRDAR